MVSHCSSRDCFNLRHRHNRSGIDGANALDSCGSGDGSLFRGRVCSRPSRGKPLWSCFPAQRTPVRLERPFGPSSEFGLIGAFHTRSIGFLYPLTMSCKLRNLRLINHKHLRRLRRKTAQGRHGVRHVLNLRQAFRYSSGVLFPILDALPARNSGSFSCFFVLMYFAALGADVTYFRQQEPSGFLLQLSRIMGGREPFVPLYLVLLSPAMIALTVPPFARSGSSGLVGTCLSGPVARPIPDGCHAGPQGAGRL